MPGLVPFTDNFHDLSNSQGYQFEFYCERCGNGYRSAFLRDKVEMGRGFLRVVGSFFGGAVEDVSRSAEQWRYDRATNSPAKDRALAASVTEVRDSFRQCRGCGDWMCAALCWNDEIGQCLRCAPILAEEIARAQSSAQVDQVWQKARETDWAANVDVQTRAKMNCPSCNAKVDGGKFCSSCGATMHVPVTCGSCGCATNKIGAVFCSECGTRM